MQKGNLPPLLLWFCSNIDIFNTFPFVSVIIVWKCIDHTVYQLESSRNHISYQFQTHSFLIILIMKVWNVNTILYFGGGGLVWCITHIQRSFASALDDYNIFKLLTFNVSLSYWLLKVMKIYILYYLQLIHSHIDYVWYQPALFHYHVDNESLEYIYCLTTVYVGLCILTHYF